MRDDSLVKGNQPSWKRNQKLNEREKKLDERENQLNQLIKQLEKYGLNIDINHQYDSSNSAEEYSFPENLKKQWKDGLSQSKLFLPDNLATSYLLSLISGFYSGSLILLNGSVGVGKTSLVKHSANFIGGKHEIIPVRPAWLDPSDLLGFFDPIHEIFRPSPFLTALKDAEKNSDCLYLVCLDELNLAKIENYGADLLSVLEYSRNHQPDSNEQQRELTLYSTSLVEMIQKEITENPEPVQDQPDSQQAPSDKKLVQRKNNLCQYPPNFTVPNNLVLIGTLNSDETTYELSPKVIDRSYVVSYPPADLDKAEIKTILASGDFEKTKISKISVSALNKEIKQRIGDSINDEHWKTIKEWNIKYLSELGIPLGYRSARDYAIFSAVADLIGLTQDDCIGHFLFTKILPRIFFDSSNDDKVGKCKEWLDELKKYKEFDSCKILDRLYSAFILYANMKPVTNNRSMFEFIQINNGRLQIKRDKEFKLEGSIDGIKRISVSLWYDTYLQNNQNEWIRPDIRLKLSIDGTTKNYCFDAKYRDYAEQGSEQFIEDVLGVARDKYLVGIKNKLENLSASFILHTDERVNYWGEVPFREKVDEIKEILNDDRWSITDSSDYIGRKPRKILSTLKDGKTLKNLPTGGVDHRYGAIMLRPDKNPEKELKKLLRLLLQYHGSLETYCLSCGCSSKSMEDKPDNSKQGKGTYCYCDQCHQFWVVQHCLGNGHRLLKFKDSFHKRDPAADAGKWMYICPICKSSYFNS